MKIKLILLFFIPMLAFGQEEKETYPGVVGLTYSLPAGVSGDNSLGFFFRAHFGGVSVFFTLDENSVPDDGDVMSGPCPHSDYKIEEYEILPMGGYADFYWEPVENLGFVGSLGFYWSGEATVERSQTTGWLWNKQENLDMFFGYGVGLFMRPIDPLMVSCAYKHPIGINLSFGYAFDY